MANIIRGDGTWTIQKWSGEVVMNDREFAAFLVGAIDMAVRSGVWGIVAQKMKTE